MNDGVTLPAFDAILDLYLATKRDYWDDQTERGRSLAKGWRASSVGYCIRRQYLQRLGRPETRRPDSDALRKFEWGDMVEDLVRIVYTRLGLVVAKQTRLRDDELNVTGNGDLIVSGRPAELDEIAQTFSPEWQAFLVNAREAYVKAFGISDEVIWLEVKSASSNAMRKLFKEKKPYSHNALQLGTYEVIAEAHPEQLPAPVDRYAMQYVGKDVVGGLRYFIGKKERDAALERLELLNLAYASGCEPDFLPCECKGFWVESCPFCVQIPLGLTCCGREREWRESA